MFYVRCPICINLQGWKKAAKASTFKLDVRFGRMTRKISPCDFLPSVPSRLIHHLLRAQKKMLPFHSQNCFFYILTWCWPKGIQHVFELFSSLWLPSLGGIEFWDFYYITPVPQGVDEYSSFSNWETHADKSVHRIWSLVLGNSPDWNRPADPFLL